MAVGMDGWKEIPLKVQNTSYFGLPVDHVLLLNAGIFQVVVQVVFHNVAVVVVHEMSEGCGSRIERFVEL